jgi:ribosome-binding protein aMBF1 (putative translation factor)
MSHQDWETVIVKGKSFESVKNIPCNKTVVTTHRNKQETNLTIKKIYDPENPNAEPEIRPVLIDKVFARNMTQMRLVKKMSQKDLASACALDVKIISDYEKGGCARNGSYISKIKKVLGNF